MYSTSEYGYWGILVIGVFAITTSTGKHSDKPNKKETTITEVTTKTNDEPLTQSKKNQRKIDKVANELEKEVESEIKAEEKTDKNNKTKDNNKNEKTTEEIKVEENNNDEGWSPMVTIHKE